MKLRFLLLVFLFAGSLLHANDTIRSLIITEARMDRPDQAYVEISNVGTEPIQMSDFEFGHIRPWELPWQTLPNHYFMLPEKVLEPGESYTIAAVLDFVERAHFVDPENYATNGTKKEWWTLADMQLHLPDVNGDETDSISPYAPTLTLWQGRECLYIEQHFPDGDSVVIDQVGGVFDREGGYNQTYAYDVAGVIDATRKTTLVRRYNVKTGNTNFAEARGVGINDSEWMPIPHLYDEYEPFRNVFWTVGNHGDYNLDENTLESDIVDVDFANKVITAPWGIRNQDSFMKVFKKKPGIAWHYDLSEAREDSAYNSARTGDKLTVYVCGSDLDFAIFDIVVAEPKADANNIVPKFRTQADGYYAKNINSGSSEVFEVTLNESGMDTITESFYGIPFSTEVDSLFKYLEIAPNATREIVWVDGMERAAVKNGDILKVKAANGDIREYFIKLNKYLPNHNANLSSITWPDIPDFYKGIFGWIGDTIPNFGATVLNYKVQVPLDVSGVPALIAKAEDLNSTVEVKRAVNLEGNLDQRTVSFKVTAEDGILTNTYNVQLEKEKNPANLQPFIADPFLSEFVIKDQFANNFIEICNPGNQPLDLSNYMFYIGGASNPAEAIQSTSNDEDWLNRYNKYVPGYKWVGEADWVVEPAILEQDLSVNSVVLPGDVFVMADIVATPNSGYPWWASEQADIIFQTDHNPWGESTNKGANWHNNNFHMFKILNDSVKLGLKPATDPYDFELIETFGMGDGTSWVIGGSKTNQVHNYIRKPEYYKGKSEYAESFGTNEEDTEWLTYSQNYWRALNIPWPYWRLNVTLDVGKHFMNEVTSYKSTISSVVYKVSEGYSLKEKIYGMTTGIKVNEFISNIIRADELQLLKVTNVGSGAEMAGDAVLNNNDTLTVMSADSTNITKYVLEVSESGLSSNALLSSSRYNIEITSQPKSASDEDDNGAGIISGFEYGTSLKTILANIVIPKGAMLTMINGDGAYVPLKQLNFDTTYVNVTVNSDIYFDVMAENGITKIVYQLQPETSENYAFITSTAYAVSQKDFVINYVPRGSSVDVFLSNLVPTLGASIQLVDKLGHERTIGRIVADDKVVVTSANGSIQTVYFISLLRTEFIKETTYLAYILSNVYGIDQVNYEIDGVSGITSLSEFYSNIKTSEGAIAVVVDESGNEKTGGDIDRGDMVKVTSADGKIIVMYTFRQLTSTQNLEANNIEIYPNPTNGKLNISGAGIGNRIQVFNSTGMVVHDMNIQNSIEVVSLRNESAGIYLIVVSDENKVLSRHKAIKK